MHASRFFFKPTAISLLLSHVIAQAVACLKKNITLIPATNISNRCHKITNKVDGTKPTQTKPGTRSEKKQQGKKRTEEGNEQKSRQQRASSPGRDTAEETNKHHVMCTRVGRSSSRGHATQLLLIICRTIIINYFILLVENGVNYRKRSEKINLSPNRCKQ